jgi:hypothetical protein
MTLNEITEAICAIIDQCVDGEITPELQAQFDAIDVPLAEKVDGYKHALLKLEAQAEARKAVAAPYIAEAKALANNADRIKRYLHATMVRIGVRELKGNSGRFYLQRNGAKKLIYDVHARIPDELQRCRVVLDAEQLRALRGVAEVPEDHVSVELDTEKLRDLLERNEPLPLIGVVDGNELRYLATLEAGDHVRVK